MQNSARRCRGNAWSAPVCGYLDRRPVGGACSIGSSLRKFSRGRRCSAQRTGGGTCGPQEVERAEAFSRTHAGLPPHLRPRRGACSSLKRREVERAAPRLEAPNWPSDGRRSLQHPCPQEVERADRLARLAGNPRRFRDSRLRIPSLFESFLSLFEKEVRKPRYARQRGMAACAAMSLGPLPFARASARYAKPDMASALMGRSVGYFSRMPLLLVSQD